MTYSESFHRRLSDHDKFLFECTLKTLPTETDKYTTLDLQYLACTDFPTLSGFIDWFTQVYDFQLTCKLIRAIES